MAFFKKIPTAKKMAAEAAAKQIERNKLQTMLEAEQVKAIEKGQDPGSEKFVAMRLRIDALDNTVKEIKRQIAELLIRERKQEDALLPKLQDQYDSAFNDILAEAGQLLGETLFKLKTVGRPEPQQLVQRLNEVFFATMKKTRHRMEPLYRAYVSKMNQPMPQTIQDMRDLKQRIARIKGRQGSDPGLLQNWAKNNAERMIREAQS